MTTLAIDVMGGDYAPQVIIKGSVMSLLKTSNLKLILYGNQNQINPLLKKYTPQQDFYNVMQKIEIVHTNIFLKMNVANLREQIINQPNSSMLLALKDTNDNKTDGMISAGPTQALILSSYLMIKRIETIKKIALAPIYNSFDNKKRILLDAGANINLKPENLLDFAICANAIAKELLNIQHPKIKLLNIGTENNKGRELEIEAYKLLSKQKNIIFCGNEEPDNLLTSEADILLSDGFTANIALKTYKGVIKNLNQNFKNILTSNYIKKIISKLLFQKKIKQMQKQIDPEEIGGAIVLGLKKIIIKAHGSTKHYGFSQAILQGQKLIESNVIEKISKHINTE